MRESVVLPAREECALRERRPPSTDAASFVPFRAERASAPEFARFGTGYHTYVTGLTHDERGLPATDDAETHGDLVRRQCEKIAGAVEELTHVEQNLQEGATVGLISYGISGRSAAGAVRQLRDDGVKVSHLRLVGVFPFPERVVREFAASLDRVVVPEMNLGQLCHVVRASLEGAAVVERVSKIGGEIITPDEICRAVVEHGEPVGVSGEVA
jgi:2-oxoglutarate ferredoxin oxidoreductase subunit alpha